jgi:hypothetical protein
MNAGTVEYVRFGLGMKYKIEYSTDYVNFGMYADKTSAFSVPGTNSAMIMARYVRITLTGTQTQGGSLYSFTVNGG